MRKILLNKSRSKESMNKTNFIPVELNREMSLFQDEMLSDTVDALKVYEDEKNKSTKHRFIFTLYPLCTNILFNKISEIVYKEGSDDADVLTNEGSFPIPTGAISGQKLNRLQAIRNTEYSNKQFNFSYHCGLDIFNNHLLRAKEDVSVQKPNGSTYYECIVYDSTDSIVNSSSFNALGDAFNTIGDIARNSNGKPIYTYLPLVADKDTEYNCLYINKGVTNEFMSPLYLFDTIQSFEEAYQNGIKRQNGWVGFINPSTFRIPVRKSTDIVSTTQSQGSGEPIGTFEDLYSEDYYVNRCINSREGCEFIDFYPGRDLFSFTPKKNKYRQRIEKNWDYCLTYPYKSIYIDPTKTILKGKNFGIALVKNDNGLSYKEYTGSNGIKTALFCSPVKHNLKVGDKVFLNFGQKQNDATILAGRVKCTIVSLGNSREHEDRYFSIRMTDFQDYIGLSDEIVGFSKIAQGNLMCEYYFRIFKKFDGNYNSVLNRLAFAGTTYGDEVSQIVYTDDIDIKEYKDNHGRPLTEVYLTVLKANRGYKEWYEGKTYNDSTIEYSHAFGKVTSGLDLPEIISNKEYPTVRFQHNIEWGTDAYTDMYKAGKYITTSSKFIEDDITIKSTEEFYGDLVELNPITLNETVLEDVYHRFNTAQREATNNSLYSTIYYDEIAGDIYDADGIDVPRIRSHSLNYGYAHLDPEGYIYKPHYKITIGQFENTINEGDDMIIIVENPTKVTTDTSDIYLSFDTTTNYSLLPNDMVSVMSEDGHIFKFRVISHVFNEEKAKHKYESVLDNGDEEEIKSLDLENCRYFKHNLNIPDYAYMLPDGSGRHLWRNIQQPSTWSLTDELYNTTFTNGAFYHHQNIIFPVRRQDPFQKYGMYIKDGGGKPAPNNFRIQGTEFDNSNTEFITPNITSSCF